MTCYLQVGFIIILILFIFCVGIVFLLTIKIIFPRSNPSDHIKADYKPEGLFYLWKLDACWKDGFINRKSCQLEPSLENYLSSLAEIKNTDILKKDLAYELLKVSYIREIKIKRMGFVKIWIMGSLILSLILVCMHFIGLSYYMPKGQ